MKTEALAVALKNALDDKKAQDVQLISLAGRSVFADYFLIATGTSSTHVTALAAEVDRCASKLKVHVLGVEGLPLAQWVLVDVGDVIVHIFQPEIRGIYALEKLWSPQTLMPEERKSVKRS